MADAALDDDVDVFVTTVTLEDAAVFRHNQVSFDVRSCFKTNISLGEVRFCYACILKTIIIIFYRKLTVS
jgi:hypothetical protein